MTEPSYVRTGGNMLRDHDEGLRGVNFYEEGLSRRRKVWYNRCIQIVKAFCLYAV